MTCPAFAWNSFSLPAYRTFSGFDSRGVITAFQSDDGANSTPVGDGCEP